MSSKASTTIGFERRFNRLLALDRVEAFVAASTDAVTLRPPNVERIVALNRGPFLAAPPSLAAVDVVDGAVVLDVRTAAAFAAGHVASAVNVPLDSSAFGTKAAFVLSPDEPLVLHASSSADAELAARRLRAVGLLEIAGYLEAPATPAQLEPLGLDELEALVARGDVELLDVREKDERDDGYIPGSRHVPYRRIRAFAAELDDSRTVATICESGARATIAASVLAAAGIDARPVLDGGVGAWRARGGRTVEFRRCGSG